MADKICPDCGSAIDPEEIFCSNCGTKVSADNPEMAQQIVNESKPLEGDSTWKSIEPFVKLGGEFSWILYILALIVRFILILKNGIIPSTKDRGWFFVVWGFIAIALSVYLGIIFILPFAQKCKQKDWYFLLNDVIIIGGFRIPKMLLLGVVLQIFSYWGASLVLIVAFIVIFLGPYKFMWQIKDIN